MLVFSDANLVFLAVPKTGTTAVEVALRDRADICFARHRKHMNTRRFRRKIAPFLKDSLGVDVETIAVMREPVEQIRSWYRYRTAKRLTGKERSTEGYSFDEFVQALISDAPPEFARIGSQFTFLTDKNGRRAVDHLFAYDNQIEFRRFLENRLGQSVNFETRNVSPRTEAPLSRMVESELRTARANEFELFDQLMQSNGYLGPS